jgi:hypothetical protein
MIIAALNLPGIQKAKGEMSIISPQEKVLPSGNSHFLP